MEYSSQDERFLWCIWTQNTETEFYYSFFVYANNPDQALVKCAKKYFDKVMDKCLDDGCGKKSKLMGKILYPREKIKIVKIKIFAVNEFYKLIEYKREKSDGEYYNS